MNDEYLKSKQDIQVVREAINTAAKLERAEAGIKQYAPEFIQASKAVTNATGFELWHTEAHGGSFFWRHGERESIKYDSRVSALRALLDEEIRWAK